MEKQKRKYFPCSPEKHRDVLLVGKQMLNSVVFGKCTDPSALLRLVSGSSNTNESESRDGVPLDSLKIKEERQKKNFNNNLPDHKPDDQKVPDAFHNKFLKNPYCLEIALQAEQESMYRNSIEKLLQLCRSEGQKQIIRETVLNTRRLVMKQRLLALEGLRETLKLEPDALDVDPKLVTELQMRQERYEESLQQKFSNYTRGTVSHLLENIRCSGSDVNLMTSGVLEEISTTLKSSHCKRPRFGQNIKPNAQQYNSKLKNGFIATGQFETPNVFSAVSMQLQGDESLSNILRILTYNELQKTPRIVSYYCDALGYDMENLRLTEQIFDSSVYATPPVLSLLAKALGKNIVLHWGSHEGSDKSFSFGNPTNPKVHLLVSDGQFYPVFNVDEMKLEELNIIIPSVQNLQKIQTGASNAATAEFDQLAESFSRVCDFCKDYTFSNCSHITERNLNDLDNFRRLLLNDKYGSLTAKDYDPKIYNNKVKVHPSCKGTVQALNVPQDNRCLYTALSQCLFGTNELATTIKRAIATDFVKNESHYLEQFINMGYKTEEVMSIRQKLFSNAGRKQWGTDEILLMASKVLNRKIVVYSYSDNLSCTQEYNLNPEQSSEFNPIILSLYPIQIQPEIVNHFAPVIPRNWEDIDIPNVQFNQFRRFESPSDSVVPTVNIEIVDRVSNIEQVVPSTVCKENGQGTIQQRSVENAFSENIKPQTHTCSSVSKPLVHDRGLITNGPHFKVSQDKLHIESNGTVSVSIKPNDGTISKESQCTTISQIVNNQLDAASKGGTINTTVCTETLTSRQNDETVTVVSVIPRPEKTMQQDVNEFIRIVEEEAEKLLRSNQGNFAETFTNNIMRCPRDFWKRKLRDLPRYKNHSEKNLLTKAEKYNSFCKTPFARQEVANILSSFGCNHEVVASFNSAATNIVNDYFSKKGKRRENVREVGRITGEKAEYKVKATYKDCQPNSNLSISSTNMLPLESGPTKPVSCNVDELSSTLQSRTSHHGEMKALMDKQDEPQNLEPEVIDKYDSAPESLQKDNNGNLKGDMGLIELLEKQVESEQAYRESVIVEDECKPEGKGAGHFKITHDYGEESHHTQGESGLAELLNNQAGPEVGTLDDIAPEVKDGYFEKNFDFSDEKHHLQGVTSLTELLDKQIKPEQVCPEVVTVVDDIASEVDVGDLKRDFNYAENDYYSQGETESYESESDFFDSASDASDFEEKEIAIQLGYSDELEFKPLQDFNFCISSRDMDTIYDFKDAKFRLHIWPTIISKYVTETQKCCSFVSKRPVTYYKHKEKHGFCRMSGKCNGDCEVKFSITISETPKKGEPVQCFVSSTGNFKLLQRKTTGRPLTSVSRENMGQELKHNKPIKVYTENMSKIRETPHRLLHNNHPQMSKSVLSTLKAETTKQITKSSNPHEDVLIFAKETKEKDTTSKVLKGYIHHTSDNEENISVHMYTEASLRLLASSCKRSNVVPHLDATGSVVKTVGEKQMLLYTCVARTSKDLKYPVADMLSQRGRSVDIGFFLRKLKYDTTKIYAGSKQPLGHVIVTDFSLAMLHGVSEGANQMDLRAYMDLTWDIQLGKTELDKDKSVLFICTSHLVKAVSRLMSKHIPNMAANKELRLLAINSVVRLQESTTIMGVRETMERICKVFGSKTLPSLELAENKAFLMSTGVRTELPDLQIDSDANFSTESNDKLTKSSPYYQYFTNLKEKFTSNIINEEEDVNPFYNTKVLDVIHKNYVPYVGLFSAMMLNKTGRSNEIRLTNAAVESEFNTIKHHYHQDAKTQYNSFIRRHHEFHQGKITAVLPAVQTQKHVEAKQLKKGNPRDDDIGEEKWSRRKKTKAPRYVSQNKAISERIKTKSPLHENQCQSSVETDIPHPDSWMTDEEFLKADKENRKRFEAQGIVYVTAVPDEQEKKQDDDLRKLYEDFEYIEETFATYKRDRQSGGYDFDKLAINQSEKTTIITSDSCDHSKVGPLLLDDATTTKKHELPKPVYEERVEHRRMAMIESTDGIEIPERVLTSSEMKHFLHPKSWLDDTHVDFYLSLINRKHPSRYVISNAQYIHKSFNLDRTKKTDPTYTWQSAREECTDAVDCVYLKSYTDAPLILHPLKIVNHWLLLGIDRESQTCTIFDSGRSMHPGLKFKHVAEIRNKVLPSFLKNAEEAASWTVTFDDSFGYQNDVNSCGVFLLEAAERILSSNVSLPEVYGQGLCQDLEPVNKRFEQARNMLATTSAGKAVLQECKTNNSLKAYFEEA